MWSQYEEKHQLLNNYISNPLLIVHPTSKKKKKLYKAKRNCGFMLYKSWE